MADTNYGELPPFFDTSGNVNKKYKAAGGKGWDYNPKATYEKTVNASDRNGQQSKGITNLFDQFANFMNDAMRNTGNLGSTVFSYLTGQDNPVEGGGYGDYLVGRTPIEGGMVTPAGTSEEDKVAAALAARDAYWKEQMDALKKPDPYDSIISTLTGRKTTDAAKLKALYDAASTYVTGQAPSVEDIYTKAKAGYEGGTQAGTNLINANYAGARSQLENMLKSLGIEYTAGNIMDRGQDLSGGQTAATDKLASFLTSNLARNTASQTSALENLQNMAQAIQAEGARSQSINLRSLEDQIGKARMSQQQYKDELQKAAIAAAAKQSTGITSDQASALYKGFYDEAKAKGWDDKASQTYANNQTNRVVNSQ